MHAYTCTMLCSYYVHTHTHAWLSVIMPCMCTQMSVLMPCMHVHTVECVHAMHLHTQSNMFMPCTYTHNECVHAMHIHTMSVFMPYTYTHTERIYAIFNQEHSFLLWMTDILYRTTFLFINLYIQYIQQLFS